MPDYKVSVICLTYNHRAFIRECLEGFVRQKTTFPFQVIVHDDASTDGTAEIVKEYAQRYPHIIQPILQQENQWQKRMTLKTFVYPRLQGEYVAFCEGDDYWTDENKLQKQVDFLDANPDYAVCFHPVQVYWQDSGLSNKLFPSEAYRFNKDILTLEDLLKHNFIQTNSVLLKWRFYKDSYDLIPGRILPGDWFIFLLHAELGKIKFMPEVMSVYRKHQQGIWYGARRSKKWFETNGTLSLRFFEALKERYGYEHTAEFVLLKYGCRFAGEDKESTTLLRTLKRSLCLLAVPFGILFSFTPERKLFWINYGKALCISLSWLLKK